MIITKCLSHCHIPGNRTENWLICSMNIYWRICYMQGARDSNENKIPVVAEWHWTRWGSLSSVWENRGRSLDEPWRGSRAHPDHDNDTDAQSKGRVECLCLSCPLEITVMWLKEVGRARQAQYTDRKKERETGYDVGMESPLTRILKCQRKYRNCGAFIWISNWEDFRKQETWSCFDGCQTWEKNENSQRK